MMKTEQEVLTEIERQKEFIAFKIKEYNVMLKSLIKTPIDEYNFNQHVIKTEAVFREIERAQRIISCLHWIKNR